MRLAKAAFFFSLCTLPALAQSSPNADILKMIQADLPESAIVDKITAGTGHWDTSVDALIALKKAGATPAEIKALTAPLAAPPPPVATAPAQPIIIAGGALLRSPSGDPYLQFPQRMATLWPNGQPSNSARLMSYKGQPAIVVPAEHMGDTATTAGSLVITRDTVEFNPYLRFYFWGAIPEKTKGKFIIGKNDVKYAEAIAFSMPRSEVQLRYVSLKKNYLPSDRATIFGKKFVAYDIGWHYTGRWAYTADYDTPCKDSVNCSSDELEAFVRDLIHNFDETIAPLLQATRITNVDTQLSAAAHFVPATENDFPKYAAIYQTQLDHLPPPTQNTGGGFLDGLGTALQIVSAGATALQQSNAGGNTAAAQAASRAQFDQTVSNIMSAPGTTAYTPSATSAAATAGSAYTPTSGTGSYTGPNAQWVHTLLTSAGTYSCSPAQPPTYSKNFNCQRDGEVYKAQQLAWAAECSAQTGHPDDATKDASIMMDTLHSAKSLCGAQAPTGPVRCQTDTVLSCSQLP